MAWSTCPRCDADVRDGAAHQRQDDDGNWIDCE
jgi:hypothetical protein